MLTGCEARFEHQTELEVFHPETAVPESAVHNRRQLTTTVLTTQNARVRDVSLRGGTFKNIHRRRQHDKFLFHVQARSA